MFTGIIQSTGTIIAVEQNGSNRRFWIESPLSDELKPDQSLSHDGVCLTVEEVQTGRHRVTAIAETLKKTTLNDWVTGTLINLETCLRLNDRLDGHFVQGHVDCTAVCLKRKEKKGSWEFEFGFPGRFAPLLIEKGSIAVNGISLTAFNVKRKSFTVAVIPYTFEHSNIGRVKKTDTVNVEFDVIGKYLHRNTILNKTKK